MEQSVRPDTNVMEALPEGEQQRLAAILNFWHKLEFFIPFDLDRRLDDADDGRVRWLHINEPAGDTGNLWQVGLPAEYELKGFYLYLGVFDKAEITKVCAQAIGQKSKLDLDEEYERTDLEGNTCFARVTINPAGGIVFDSEPDAISVSTVPWALGQLTTHSIAALGHDDFEQSKARLSELLQNFQSYRRADVSRGAQADANPLTMDGILALHRLFCEWASYTPPGEPRAVVEIRAGKKKQVKAVDESTEAGAEDLTNRISALAMNQKADDAKEEKDDIEEVEQEIGILNSFFIQDIERALATVRSGHIPCTLKNYLTPLRKADRLDLDSEEGSWAILDALHPKHLNRGHWLDEPGRAMSLMQQFAINSVIGLAESPRLFAINGPPGTGKTTLLKDIFAEIVVRRARVLSHLSNAGDAFQKGSIQVRFSGGSDATIVQLKPELTGFEMVVASSNNAAVDNISRDLPKAGKSLGESWSSAGYLKPVAHKIAAQLEDGSFVKLPEADVPWGLISCALGKWANRRAFKERFAFMKVARDASRTWRGNETPLTIYEWIDGYKGPSFRDAADQFRKIDQQIEARFDQLTECANLLQGRLRRSGEANVADAKRRLDAAGVKKDRIQSEMREMEAGMSKLRDGLAALQEDERLINRSAPGWWAKLRRIPLAQLHKEQVRNNAKAQLQTRRQLAAVEQKYQTSLKPAWNTICQSVAKAEQELKEAQAAQELKERRWTQIREEFGHLNFPDELSDLKSDDFEKHGLWHDEELARLRSSLFASALALHEAWLAEVARPKPQGGSGFRGNIRAVTTLLSNRRPEERDHAEAVWQSLFMIIPVVSTTFASFANQFRDLAPATLGWVFIDEAGQAVPQAAVGALWRAKHAVVVGDPRQIEPIFTLPSKLISELSCISPHTSNGGYSPNRTSVQRLADDANRCGINLSNGGDDSVWVGSPLRVHRRCIEPMFSWSNQIAYDDRMVFGLKCREKPNGPPIPCDSAWIDIRGRTRKRQEVPEQTQFVTDLLVTVYQMNRDLPGLYVISPFKAIKNELRKTLNEANWSRGRPEIARPKKQDLRKWCKERVGTIHTFQGKEEDSVILVLGADEEHAGSADWASSKPNILNVALTRAKRRFYIVGNRQLWGGMGSFRLSAEKLASIEPGEFLNALQHRMAQRRASASMSHGTSR